MDPVVKDAVARSYSAPRGDEEEGRSFKTAVVQEVLFSTFDMHGELLGGVFFAMVCRVVSCLLCCDSALWCCVWTSHKILQS